MDHADLVALAESGHLEAQFTVGLRHYWGLHQVPQQDDVARRYFSLCAQQGLSESLSDKDGSHLMAFAALAVMCFAGYGGSADKDEGKRWAQHALQVGSAIRARYCIPIQTVVDREFAWNLLTHPFCVISNSLCS